MTKRVFLACFALFAAGVLMGGEFACQFVAGKWSDNDWILVKSPRWTNIGAWIQKADCIVNRCPEDATKEEMLGKRAQETYTSMVLKNKVTGNATITTTTSFDFRMAPEIVIAGPLGADKDGYPEYREHWEIVLYDQGVNVWHHEFRDGKPFWRKAAFVNATLEPGKKYTMTAKIQFTQKVPILEVSCGDICFGCMLPTLPTEYYAGITACEGLNSFYDFKLSTPDKK